MSVRVDGEGRYAGASGGIHYRLWSEERPRWVVLLAHGFGDHSARWQRYAETLVAAGGAVLACDHRGHGLSDGPRASIADFDAAAGDYLGLLDVPDLPQGTPVLFAGHSMGGLIAARAVMLRPDGADALILSSTRLGPWPEASALLKRLDRDQPLPPAAAGHPLLDPEAQLDPTSLSRDPDVVEAFAADELSYVGAFPHETLRAWIDLQDRLTDAPTGRLDLPTLYLHGGADPLLPYRPSVSTLSRLVREDLEVRVFAGARHSLYNEINRAEIFMTLQGFIARVIACPPPSKLEAPCP